MTNSRSTYITLEEAEKKDYYRKDIKSVCDEIKLDYFDINNPIFTRDIVFIVSGVNREYSCCMEPVESHWEYCPICGEEVVERFYRVFRDRKVAEKNKDAAEHGIKEMIMFTVRNRNEEYSEHLFARGE